jgi:polar amino acid transport system substrate-binding protein
MRRMFALAVVVLLAAGCQWPRDAAGTLADVSGGLLRVGVMAHPPWTQLADVAGGTSVTGAEAALVHRLAERLDTRVEWVTGTESTLMAALKERVLDLVVGGLDARAPWTREASLTLPYLTVRTVVAVPAGVPPPAGLEGVRVAVPAGTAEVAALADEGAEPVPVAEISGREGMPVAVEEWRLDALGLRPTGVDVARHEHVWAVPLGENGWQVAVERFLLDLPAGEVERLLVEAGA